jgi:DNA processing protein
MNDAEQVALLDLCSIPGIGSGRLRNLIAAMGSPQAVLAAPLQRLIRVPGIERATAIKIKNEVDKTFTETQRNFISQYNIRIISYWQNEYPTRLKKIYDPPALLFVKGQLCNQDQLAVGIVGTRMPSHYGRVITEQFSKELVHNKFTIVSGLARGVDTIAHQIAIRSGGRTIAVMGSGFDQIYPPENTKLVERIRSRG